MTLGHLTACHNNSRYSTECVFIISRRITTRIKCNARRIELHILHGTCHNRDKSCKAKATRNIKGQARNSITSTSKMSGEGCRLIVAHAIAPIMTGKVNVCRQFPILVITIHHRAEIGQLLLIGNLVRRSGSTRTGYTGLSK